jgi:asparagine synthase (glutamine-hydrolysing)
VCGIAGEYAFSPDDTLPDETIARMVECIRHRGPDRLTHARRGRVALGIARLSVIDPENSHQPIPNENGDVWLVFNGEIYNFKQLRKELEANGHVFKTRGDGEVIVHGYEQWGLDVLQRLRGMFAIALWDERAQRLVLARDRMGIKPLYVHRSPSRVMFASEAKALFAGGVRAEPRTDLLDCYLALRYVPAPQTMFRGVEKLLPGCYTTVSATGVEHGTFAELQLFPKSETGEDAAADELLTRFRRSVEYRLQSDVPLGVFLSGGLDSGFLVALTREFKNDRLDTFTVGFNRGGIYNEIPTAESVARRYGTTQHNVVVDAERFIAELPAAVRAMDEPMADPSSVPMRILSLEARRHVTVILSGEGSDELFAGYGRYLGERAARRMVLPEGAARAAAKFARKFLSRRSLKALEGVAIRDPDERHLFWQTIVGADDRRRLLTGTAEPQAKPVDLVRDVTRSLDTTDALERLFYYDLRGWLADDLLLKKDKMGMSASIEARVPYLDQDVVDFATRLPAHMKIRGMKRKYIFRKVIHDYLPRDILARPKVGFAVPLADWFRGELREFMRTHVAEPGGFLDDYIDLAARRQLYHSHLGGADLSLPLYSLLVLELWGRIFYRAESADAIAEAMQKR